MPTSNEAWRLLRWNLAAASLGAAAMRFAVAVAHFNEYRPYGVFFLAVAWFQAIWATLVVTTAERRLLLVGIVLNAAVVAIWVWSRTAGLPIGPQPGTPEEVGAADSISTGLEAAIVVWATLPLVPFFRWRRPSRGVVVGSALFVWAIVITLTVLAILAEAESTPVH
jgi:hypothetical protein